MMKMMYSLSTGRPPIGVLRRAPVLRAEHLLHFLGQLLLRRDELALELVRDLGVLRRWPGTGRGRRSGRRAAARASASPPTAAARASVRSRFRISVCAADLVAAPAAAASRRPSRSCARLLERLRLAELAQHEQQDDRAERAADRVEERHAEHFEVARATRRFMASPSPGIRNEPLVRRASVQNAPARHGSPSIGIRITLTGTPVGILAERALEQLEPAVAVDGLARCAGGVAPCVGRPSVMMKTLSGAGLSVFISVNAFSRLVPSAGTVRRRFATTSVSACASLPSSQLAGAVRHQRPRLRVEREHLELRLRPESATSASRPWPRCAATSPTCSRRVSDMLRSRITLTTVSSSMLAETSTRISDALAAELEAAQVLAIAGADESLDAIAGLARAPACRPRAAACSPRADFRSALSFSIASRRESVVLSASASCSLSLLGLLEHAVGQAFGALGLGRRRLQAVAQHDEVGVALQHLFLELVDFGAQLGRVVLERAGCLPRSGSCTAARSRRTRSRSCPGRTC